MADSSNATVTPTCVLHQLVGICACTQLCKYIVPNDRKQRTHSHILSRKGGCWHIMNLLYFPFTTQQAHMHAPPMQSPPSLTAYTRDRMGAGICKPPSDCLSSSSSCNQAMTNSGRSMYGRWPLQHEQLRLIKRYLVLGMRLSMG